MMPEKREGQAVEKECDHGERSVHESQGDRWVASWPPGKPAPGPRDGSEACQRPAEEHSGWTWGESRRGQKAPGFWANEGVMPA